MTTIDLGTIDRPGWAVHLEALVGEGIVGDDTIADLLPRLAPHAGIVSGSCDGTRFGVTMSIDATDLDVQTAIDATTKAASIIGRHAQQVGLRSLDFVRIEAMTYGDQEAELRGPLIPELVGVSEIADILAVSRQRAHQLTKRKDFPAPIATLSAGPVWTRPSLNRFVEEWHAGKPDVTPELEDLDDAIRRLRELRNEIVHGTADPSDAMSAIALAQMLTAALREDDSQAASSVRELISSMWAAGRPVTTP